MTLFKQKAFHFIFLAISCFCALPSQAAPVISPSGIKDPEAMLDNEITRLDALIQATQQSLEGQKKLRERILEYKQIQETFLKKPEDNDLLFRLVKSAYRTLEVIKENHLTQTFDPDFIDELTVLSQAANKRGIPKP